jgi:two-component system sensor histidine kinase BaeS
MLDTLRRRLILSHILPVLLITPLVGSALIYLSRSMPAGGQSLRAAPEDLNTLFVRLEWQFVIVVGLGLLLGVFVGWSLALQMEQPLRKLTRSIPKLMDADALPPAPSTGLQEIRLLWGAIYDLAERRHALEQDRRKLLANLVHEFGRSLGALSSAAHACAHEGLEDRRMRQELVDGMQAELLGLGRLLDDLSTLRDQVIGDFKLRKQPTALDEWLSSSLNLWQGLAEEKGLAWEIDIPASLPQLNLDRERLNQALGNLISNAIKYTPAGGEIAISASANSNEIGIQVSDSGVGIPEEELEHIFTPFYRGRESAEHIDGIGLGLSIARDLIRAHGGRLEVESAPGQGSRFTMWLPKTASGKAADTFASIGFNH